MKQACDFSVLMSVYAKDDSVLFDRAIRSVFDNTWPPAQFVLVQDGPLPPSLEAVVQQHIDRPGLTVVKLPQNVGLAAALNAGLERVRHRWVLRADADDFNVPNRFERQLPHLTSGLDLVGSAIREVDRTGRPIAVRMPPLEAPAIRRFLRRRNPFNHMTVGFDVERVRACGGYPNLHLKEDYGLWATLLARGARVGNLPDILVEATAGRDMYRRRGGLQYVRSEIDLQVHLVRCGLQSWVGACAIGMMRSAVFLLPAGWRGTIYENLLRKSTDRSAN